MASSIYKINKGVNKPVEFRGLKAQYIWYLAGGILILLILFAILYIAGVNSFICIGFAGLAGTGLFIQVYRLSNRYGVHGLMKWLSRKRIPRLVKCNGRSLFINLKRS